MRDRLEPSRPLAPPLGSPVGAPAGSSVTSAASLPAVRLTTPAGLQAIGEVRWRRAIVVALNAATYAALLSIAWRIAGAGGSVLLNGLLLFAFALASPWTVLGFWNALIGLWLLHGRRDGLEAVAPFARAGDEVTPLRIKTAVLMTVRNEDPHRAILRLKTIKASLDATGEGGAFGYFLLSDTSEDAVARAEEAVFAAWKASEGALENLVYRRRSENRAFKAGNIRDFCERWGAGFTLMLPLDADSLMAGEEIVRLVRMMQAYPKIGILQTLVVGMPAASAFARIFQFGMRHGMRAYTMGQAWWVADCGPFWGHNALVRIEPFRAECTLPVLTGRPPFGGHVLSHDQVEATLMRRAGYEVRVLPRERGSWEENPPTIVEFTRRDMRWCQGNMQYVRLLNLAGLYPVSRFQMIWAILMFIGIPAATLIIALLPIASWQAQGIEDYPTGLARGLYLTFLGRYLTPKLAGLIVSACTRGDLARYGGAARFAAGAVLEMVFAFLQGAISTVRTTLFMGGLAFGRAIQWGGQARDIHRLTWGHAASQLWPQTLFGVIVCGALALISPRVLLWSLPLTAGYLAAIPFAVVTADPRFGRLLSARGICGVPEDFAPPAEIAQLKSSLPD